MLLLLSLLYQFRGYSVFFGFAGSDPKVPAMDAKRRWQEVHYVLRGKNPYDVTFAYNDEARAVAEPAMLTPPRDNSPEPDLGVPDGVIYPQWAYPSGFLIFAVPRSFLKPEVAGLMLLSTAFLWWFGFQTGRAFGWPAAIALGSAITAIGGWSGTIFLGNYALFIMAALVGVYLLAQKNRWLFAGLLLGYALLKPTIAGPFVLPLLVRGHWRIVAVAAAMVAGETALCWAMVHTPPWEMARQTIAASRHVVNQGSGLVEMLIAAGVDARHALAAVGPIVMAATIALVWIGRRAGLLALFGIAGVAARLASYHFYYDDGQMLFLILAFGLLAAKLNTPTTWLMFLIVGGSLWLPPRAAIPKVLDLQMLIWTGAAVWIALRAQSFAATDGSLTPSPVVLDGRGPG